MKDSPFLLALWAVWPSSNPFLAVVSYGLGANYSQPKKALVLISWVPRSLRAGKPSNLLGLNEPLLAMQAFTFSCHFS